MKRLLLLLFCVFPFFANAQTDKIELPAARFHTGNEEKWSLPSYEDAGWPTINTNNNWEAQGYTGYNGYAWYRFHFNLSSALKNAAYWKDSVRIFLAKIDDADEVYLNGVLIAKHGTFPEDKEGYTTVWSQKREIHLSAKSPYLFWDRQNLIAVKVYDGGGAGGIFSAVPFINMMDIVDALEITAEFGNDKADSTTITVKNSLATPVFGIVKASIYTRDPATPLALLDLSTDIPSKGQRVFKMENFTGQRVELAADFIEIYTHKKLSVKKVNPYILTPAPSASPRINNPATYGVRPGSPFLYKIAATGQRPLSYAATGLPRGLTLDPSTGIISGRLDIKGDHKITLQVKNSSGESTKELLVRCGNLLALTPPMGWNSWNCWGLSVSDKKVRSSAQALIDKGLVDHGWTYMNIDDGWEDSVRNKNGEIVANEKFPDMRGLGDWLHSQGLKFGIYSSPGPLTCGGYLGSYQHELQDAKTYAAWAIDYLKYDWCSYGRIHGEKDTSLASYMKPYKVMQKALRAQKRDIIYSLCQYGMKDVWKWGDKVDGNCWRTTGDIEDSWESLKSIGFDQNKMSPYAKPGRWNDPDMLIVGEVGWGENLHPTRLTPDEQYTHISLWCLLSAPLLIGCDISRLDPFTLNLLSNDELIEINQDVLGKQATQIIKTDSAQVWVKQLSDGTRAVGLFNLSDKYQEISLPVKELKLLKPFALRDCWRQTELGIVDHYSATIPPHGAMVLKVR